MVSGTSNLNNWYQVPERDKYFDEINENPVVYHWKYKLEEIDPSEEVIVDTLPVKQSS